MAVERYTYDLYGQVSYFDGNWTGGSSSYDNAILVSGYYQDKESGLYLARHRHLHSWLGRWLQRDPIRYRAGDVNLYRYVRNASTAYVDPSGLGDIWSEHPRLDGPAVSLPLFPPGTTGISGPTSIAPPVPPITLFPTIFDPSLPASMPGMLGPPAPPWVPPLAWNPNYQPGSDTPYVALGSPSTLELMISGVGVLASGGSSLILAGASCEKAARLTKALRVLDFAANWGGPVAIGIEEGQSGYEIGLNTSFQGFGNLGVGALSNVAKWPSKVHVTHWGPPGMTSLRPGDWVMHGQPSWVNYGLSGCPPYYTLNSCIVAQVNRSDLTAPGGSEWFKWFFGQNRYRGPEIPVSR